MRYLSDYKIFESKPSPDNIRLEFEDIFREYDNIRLSCSRFN